MTTMGRYYRVALLALITLCVGVNTLDDNQKTATRAAFKQLLKLQPPSSEIMHHRVVKPPRHMLELYQKYTHNGGMKKTTGNTVRSILPTIKGSEMLLFNVTCIGRAEEVHLAQLHLHRRRLRRSTSSSHRRRVLAPPCKVKLYRILSNTGKYRARTVPLASLPVPESIRGGWHSLDITPVLRELLLGGSPTSILQLGVRFEAPRNRQIPPEQFLSMDNETSAFVVVFSEDILDNSVHPRIPHEVRQALHQIKNDDLYLENENITAEVTLTDSSEEDDVFDDFSFDADEGLKSSRNGGQKKKAKGRKNVAKNVLDSLDGGFKDTSVIAKKKKEKLPSGNDLMDESSDEDIFSNRASKKSLQKESPWHTKENTKKLNTDLEDNGIFRRRRMHPKSRYRVRMWKDPDTASNHISNKKIKKADRLVKFTDESSSQRTQMSNLEDETIDDNGEATKRRTARTKRDDDSQFLFLNFDEPRSQTGDQRIFFHTPQNAMDDKGMVDSEELKINTSDQSNSLERTRRSIHDNELPDPLVESRESLRTSPDKLLANRVTQEGYRNTGSVIPYPAPANRRWRGEGRRRRGKGRKRDNKKKGKKAKKGVEHWHQSAEQSKPMEDRHNSVKVNSPDSLTCHRKKLQVDFADIGWANWIISPPQFEAYYCTGRCAYPLTKVVKPTNHATMQSLIAALGQQPEVPEPCCVPDKLSSTSLLYFDDNQNVVLRNYLDMSVESCACR